jgi:hypothetical protein
MGFEEMESDSVYWIQLAQDRDHWRDLLKTVMNFQVPLKSENFLIS